VSTNYGLADVVAAMRAVGLQEGDTVFSHSNIGYFGRCPEAASAPELCDLFLTAFLQVIGPAGTFVVPTFSYSFGSDRVKKEFDVSSTPGVCGMLTEHVRNNAFARRSADPMFSVAAIGRLAEAITRDTDMECFGENSCWRRLLDADGVICNLNFDSASTLIHFVERRLRVPYRRNRMFPGTIIENGKAREAEVIYFSRSIDDLEAVPNFERFDKLARVANLVRTAPLGRGSVVNISARATARLIEEWLPVEPRLLVANAQAR
jgi:aminoglycoside 3-N-acetyltransferase